MAVTRRTADFAHVAEQVDQLLLTHQLDVPAHVADGELNRRLEVVAQLLGTPPRGALVYAPTDLSHQVAADIVEAIQTLSDERPAE